MFNCSKKLKAAHAQSKSIESQILKSVNIGCFYCCAYFETGELVDKIQWCDEYSTVGRTAICPECFIDAVIPLSTDSVEARTLLSEMRHTGFAKK